MPRAKTSSRLIFKPPTSHIHIIARALLMRGNDVILCRGKGKRRFFLPGGHVEDGESVRTALRRELREELGNTNYRITDFIGTCGNVFKIQKGTHQHEINFVYKVILTSTKHPIISKENHIEFVAVSRQQLDTYPILPIKLKSGVRKWLRTGEPFFNDV